MKFKIFSLYSELFYFQSSRIDKNLKPVKTFPSCSLKFNVDQLKYFQSRKIPLNRLVFAEQVHQDVLKICSNENLNHWIPGADGLVTNIKNIYLCINTADCLPLYFYEPIKKIIGLVHAGWKGTYLQIGVKMVNFMQQHFEADKSKILVAIGPAICYKCYEVSQERYQLFFPDSKSQNRNLDLISLTCKSLIKAGIESKNIEVSNKCTSCHNQKYFSYRHDRFTDKGEMLSVICIN